MANISLQDSGLVTFPEGENDLYSGLNFQDRGIEAKKRTLKSGQIVSCKIQAIQADRQGARPDPIFMSSIQLQLYPEIAILIRGYNYGSNRRKVYRSDWANYNYNAIDETAFWIRIEYGHSVQLNDY